MKIQQIIMSINPIAVSIFNQIFTQLFGFLSFAISARYISKIDLGAWVSILLVIELFKQVWSDAIYQLIMSSKKTSRTRNKIINCFQLNIAGNIIIFLLINSYLFFKFFKNSDPYTIIYFLASFLPILIGITRFYEGIYGRNLQVYKNLTRLLLSNTFGFLLLIYMLLNGFGIYSLIAQQLTSYFLASIYYLSKDRIKIFRYLGFSIYWLYLKRIFSYIPYLFMNFVSINLDVILCTLILDKYHAGILFLAKRVSVAFISTFLYSYNSVFLATLSDSQIVEFKVKKVFDDFFLTALFVLAPVCFGLSFLSIDLIILLFGSSWFESGNALSILFLSVLLFFTYISFNNILLIKNSHLNIQLFFIIFTIALSIIAWCFVKNLSQLIFFILFKDLIYCCAAIFLANKRVNLFDWALLTDSVRILLISLMMLTIMYLFDSYYNFQNRAIELFIIIMIGILCYFIFSYFLNNRRFRCFLDGCKKAMKRN